MSHTPIVPHHAIAQYVSPLEFEYLEFRRENRDLVDLLTVLHLVEMIRKHKDSDRDEKFLQGRLKHGGEFQPDNMGWIYELYLESLDSANYKGLELFALHKQDPTAINNLKLLYSDRLNDRLLSFKWGEEEIYFDLE